MTEPLHLDDVFAGFDETWSPRVVAAVNGYDVKVARGAGEFPSTSTTTPTSSSSCWPGSCTSTCPTAR